MRGERLNAGQIYRKRASALRLRAAGIATAAARQELLLSAGEWELMAKAADHLAREKALAPIRRAARVAR